MLYSSKIKYRIASITESRK